MKLLDILIWIIAISLGILIWPLVIIVITFVLQFSMTIGLVILLAYFIKRGIDGPR